MASIFNRLNSPEPLEAPKPLAFNAPRVLTASAARLDMKNKKEVDALNRRRQSEKWQTEAWEYYDLIGEIKYAANLVASIMSRVNLYVGYVEQTSSAPTVITDVKKLDEDFAQQSEDILYLLESGNGGTGGLLRTAALNLFIAGECWLVREPARFTTGEPEKYQIRSVEELLALGGRNTRVVIKPHRDAKQSEYIELPSDGFAARIWRNHGRFSSEADSSLRGLLDICDQLLVLDRSFAAAAKSRMNAGVFFIPDGLSNLTESDGDVDGEMAGLSHDVSESFEEELLHGLMAPIEDANSAAVVTPTFVRGPDDLGEKLRHITFERPSDPQLTARADRLLERILGGLDIPKDVAAGMSSVKYSNAIIIEEQLYKAHIEPMILLIVDALTIGFLRPALRKQGWPENVVNRAVVWYDPSAITAKPSKAEAAVTLYGLKVLSADALRRANGFGPSDAPSETETVQRMAEERAVLSDAMSETLLNSIIPEDLKNQAREQALAMSDPASANALNNALGGEPAPESGPASDTIEQTQSNEQAPPTLMEP
jgi:hypothetical protein